MEGIGSGTVLLALVVIVFVVALLSYLDRPPTPARQPSEKTLRDEASQTVSIKKFSWHKGGFDNVMIITATIENRGTRTVKDIEITCTHSANSGTVIDSNRKTIYETVPAGGTKTVAGFNMGVLHSQAARSSCEITGVVVL